MENSKQASNLIKAIGSQCKVCGDYQQLGTDGWRSVKDIGKCMKCYHRTQKELKRKMKENEYET